MTIISDSTALILLAKAGILETFTSHNTIIVPKAVYEEVIKGKDTGREDSLLTERLVYEHKLIIKIPNNSVKNSIQKLFNLKGGELDVIALAHKTNDTILTDDKKCLNAAKALEIGFITSLDVIAALSKKKIISKEKANECINKLEEYGWYARDLIKKYKEAIK